MIGAAGRRRLADDAVEGEDPLAPFDPTAADHLRRHDRFPHCPDILVNSMYDPGADEVAPFEEFMGSHGGLGGPQTRPFAVVPAAWSEPVRPDRGRGGDARCSARLAGGIGGKRLRGVMPPSGETAPAPTSQHKLVSRTIIAAVIGGLIVLFALVNSQTVTIHWVVTTTQTPLIVVIAVCGLLGFAAGWLIARRAAQRKAR